MIFSERQNFSIVMMARLLEVSKSGYYSRMKKQSKPSKRRQWRDQRDHQIRVAFKETHGRFGSPRLTSYLNDKGLRVCVNTVAESMRRLGLSAGTQVKKKQTTFSNNSLQTAKNILGRDFAVDSRQPAWASDITYIKTKESWLYLAVVINLRSRRVLGFSTGSSLTQDLVIEALKMAINTKSATKDTIHHSDRGSQYCSKRYRKLLTFFGFKISMSRLGECYDNAVVESFFGHLKREIQVKKFIKKSYSETESEIHHYLHWYNSERLHSSLAQQSPLDFERQLCLAKTDST